MAPAEYTATPAAAMPQRQNRALIAVVIVALILLLLFTVAVRALLEQRLQGNESDAVASMRSLNTALYIHRQQHVDSYPKSTAELRDAIGVNLACGQPTCLKGGYAFTYEVLPPSSMGPRYSIVARPNKYGNTGRRSFYSDESGVVRGTTDNRPPTANDEPVS